MGVTGKPEELHVGKQLWSQTRIILFIREQHCITWEHLARKIFIYSKLSSVSNIL